MQPLRQRISERRVGAAEKLACWWLGGMGRVVIPEVRGEIELRLSQ